MYMGLGDRPEFEGSCSWLGIIKALRIRTLEQHKMGMKTRMHV